MKLTSTNITLTANQRLNLAFIRQAGKEAALIDESHLEELRDLLNLYFEIRDTNTTIDYDLEF